MNHFLGGSSVGSGTFGCPSKITKMITIPKFLDRSSEPVVRLIGVGNAGVNLADRMTVAHGDVISAVVMNSDMQSLSSSVVEAKVVIGPMATRGLGAGGDPEIGLDAARESVVEIESAISGADIVFLCAGLGGGTGSGAAGIVRACEEERGVVDRAGDDAICI